MCVQSNIQIIKDSEQYRTIQLNLNKRNVFSEIKAYRAVLNIHFMNPKVYTKTATIISLYEPKIGTFFWIYRWGNIDLDRFLNCRFIYLLDKKITHFSLLNNLLWIRESSERYNTFEEAYANLFSRLNKNIEELQTCNDYKWYRFVRLRKYIDQDFFFNLNSPNLFNVSRYFDNCIGRIVEIMRYDSQWQIKLEGFNNKKITIILKDNYDNEKEPLFLSDDYYKHRDLFGPIDDYEVLSVFGDFVIKNPIKIWKKGSESIIHGADKYANHPFLKEFIDKKSSSTN